MEQSDQLIIDTAQRIFADHCSADVVNSAENGHYPETLWQALKEAGLLLVWVPEESGGVGGSMGLGLSLIRQSARYALPVPLAEALVANWLLAQAGLANADQTRGFALALETLPRLENGQLHGVVEGVAFAAQVSQLVVPCMQAGQLTMALVAVDACELSLQQSLAGEPRHIVNLNGVQPLTSAAVDSGFSIELARGVAALVRAHQIAGAMERIVTLTINYVQERNQFGRALSRFQAIQHSVADIAGESALANAAVEQAARTVSQPHCALNDALMAIATAKSVAGEAAGKVTQLAHQAHGAMGFSHEYTLQQYSRRVWCWREEFGSEFYWNQWLGQQIAEQVGASDGGSAWASIARAF
ncbi:acyl-CoA dehydrogenase [Marinobacter litoralis]|uniref:acyl-CoA dehydrogenase n=1 Tax=Marinobacter litoralis TaxID=187981 RepID=UPI0018ED05E8|nr:acyl-CoA dehydrogenase [Marinobacter litoralis]MBJ6136068.1 acyl-CoA dehydrogenase family protein [Marinobacter litoralis]